MMMHSVALDLLAAADTGWYLACLVAAVQLAVMDASETDS